MDRSQRFDSYENIALSRTTRKHTNTHIHTNINIVMGFVCSTMAFIIVLKYGTNTSAEMTLAAAFLLFAYQTLDGTDGKHARNTKSGSPIGEVVDHGVDAIVTSWYVLIVLDMLPFSLTDTMGFLFLTISQCAFVTSQLTLLHIGKQFIGQFDSQESQVFVQGLLVLRALGMDGFLFGPHTSAPIVFDMSLMDLFGFMIVLNLFRVVFESAYDIQKMYYSTKKKIVGLETVRSFQYQMLQLVLFATLSWICRERLETMHWFFLSAFSIADISNHVLISRICKSQTPWFHSGLGVMLVAAIVGKDNGVIAGWVFPLVMIFLHLKFVIPRCLKFAGLLSVNLLTMKR